MEVRYPPSRFRTYSSSDRKKTVRVVVVDNQMVVRLGIHALLSSAGGIDVVGEAATGAEGLALVRAHRPDVLLLEPHLPDMQGAEGIRQMHAEAAGARIIVLSAYEKDAYVREFAAHHIAGYLLKSDSGAHIVEAIRGARHTPTGWLSPGIVRRLLHLSKKDSAYDRHRLTEREREVLEALAQGMDNSEIADRLCVSVGTVKNHLTNVYQKLDVDSRAQAIVWMHNEGLV